MIARYKILKTDPLIVGKFNEDGIIDLSFHVPESRFADEYLQWLAEGNTPDPPDPPPPPDDRPTLEERIIAAETLINLILDEEGV